MDEKKAYIVEHHYDVDGGFGDRIPTSDIIFITDKEEIAKTFCDIHDNEFVYDMPYACLSCNSITYKEMRLVTDYCDAPSWDDCKDW